MSKPTEDERGFCEQFGVYTQMTGDSRITGLITGWLLICQPAHQSITELSEALDISKASVSTVIRQMQQRQTVERYAVAGTRQHYYRLTGGGNWARILRARWMFVTAGRNLAEQGIDMLTKNSTPSDRLTEYADFLAFMDQEIGDKLIDRWERYRADRVAGALRSREESE